MDPRTPVSKAGRHGAGIRLILFVGSFGPLGHAPASGTVTVALIGIPLFALVHSWSGVAQLLLVCVMAAIAVVLHSVGDRALGQKDSRKLVWDEVVGFLVAVLWIHRFTWTLAIVAFLVERTLDIVKVPPARWIEDRWPSGWGVVGDDVVAGAYTCIVLHMGVQFVPSWMGL